MQRAIAWFGLLTVSAVLCGCGSGESEGGVPSNAPSGAFSEKFPDPMAGNKGVIRKSTKGAFNDPMNPGSRTRRSKAGKR